ncbi:C6 zinc finger domain-containing [Fusarium albosuccineum]|uniref:C6 zinc finger domain-containing n=1 Tax=Fusarium albosuccineum TaxID=1237068 RepID=A0A8H4KHR9_9HYPO|nr:C6 zinc finger domain-containing [Fusarium albosuccineum]
MPRLGFKKSRSGCQRCKERRVKCDEKRPCSACTRHGVKCVFPPADDPPPKQSRATQRQRQRHQDETEVHKDTRPAQKQRRFSSIALTAYDVFAESSPASSSNVPIQPAKMADASSMENWRLDLELMHHYTSVAYATLPRGTEICEIWQKEVPKLASRHIFLMHQLLATSAYHAAYINPSRRNCYLVHASQHQNDALVCLQGALSSINAENCHAFFVTSSMLSICAFAASCSGNSVDTSRLNELIDIFFLVRGMSNILDSHEGTLKGGTLQLLFKMEQEEEMTPLMSTIINRLKGFAMPMGTDPVVDAICTEAIATTIAWIENTKWKTTSLELRICMSWPISLTDDFLSLLRVRNPIAMAIVAYYAVILHFAGMRYWFLECWGQAVLADIACHMDPGWSHLIDWPVAAIERDEWKENLGGQEFLNSNQ